MSVINELAVPELRPDDDLNYFPPLPDRSLCWSTARAEALTVMAASILLAPEGLETKHFCRDRLEVDPNGDFGNWRSHLPG